ncbi:topoisomerase [Clostridia bacterium]|nr:topoisomerase [Clostridia bacterium]
MNAMRGVTSEQIAAAKEYDLLTYLRANEPGELKKTSADEFRTVSHSSLVISPSKGLWYWNKGHVGGRSAVDYLIKVRGMGFVDAIETVLGGRVVPVLSLLPVERSTKPALPKKLILPKRATIPSNAVKYLQRRGIHSAIISYCLKSGVLYEGVYQNPREPNYDGKPVCVFIGRDSDGKERFAALRGIGTDLKKDASGSDKRFGFRLPAKNANSGDLAIFEAPIDLLSHATFARRGDLAFDGHRLSLGGTSDVALMAFLEENPRINRISLCLDDDAAGWAAVERICDTLAADTRFACITVRADPPMDGKDYNEALLRAIKSEREESHNRNRVKCADAAL